jgi:hypothetical protein
MAQRMVCRDGFKTRPYIPRSLAPAVIPTDAREERAHKAEEPPRKQPSPHASRHCMLCAAPTNLVKPY